MPDDNGQDNSGGNPAWNDVLSIIPEDLHSQVTPHFQQWDQGVQQRFQQVHSQYDQYKDFVDNEVNPEHLRMGLGLLQAIEQNPRDVYEALAQQFNLGQQEQGEAGKDVPEGYENLPPEVIDRIRQLESGYETVAQQMMNQRQQEAERSEDVILERTMADLKNRYGNFDEQYVLAHMLNGTKPDEAVAAYQSLVEQVIAENNRPKPPRILGSGSLVPGEQRVDVTKMNPGQTRDLVTEMLKAAAQGH